MPQTETAKVGKRQSKGRSRLGCLTCRAKHVKCDERVPVCRRCERLKLSCSPHWTQSQGSRSRRSSSACSSLQALQPRRRVMVPESASSVDENNSQSHDDETLEWTILDDFASGTAASTLFLGTVELSQSLPPTMVTSPSWGPYPKTPGLTPVSPSSDGDALGYMNSQPSFQSPPLFEHLGLCSTQITGLQERDGLVLGHEEYKALRHYQDGFCLVHTSKAAAWSFPILLLQKIAHSPIAMRCAVAVSLRDIDMRRHADGLPPSGGASTLAYTHFTRASSAFREVMRQSAKPVDHIETLAAFYFHYVYLTHQRAIDKAELQRLSGAVVRYLQATSIADILTGTSPSPAPAAAMTPSVHSFLCRLILWVHREDVYAMGYGCPGDVARYFSERPKLLRLLSVASRPVLQLNWGTLYPTEQRVDDVFSAQHFDLLVRTIQLQFEITEFCWSTMGPNVSNESWRTLSSAARSVQIQEKLSIMETEFAPTFQMVTMPDDSDLTPACDLVKTVAVLVTIFYAWKIIYYRFAGASDDKIQEVLALLMQSAQHTIGRIQLKDLQRALLAAVIETKNPIHKDWILSKLGHRWRSVLENVLDRDSRHGQRINIWTLYELATDSNGLW